MYILDIHGRPLAECAFILRTTLGVFLTCSVVPPSPAPLKSEMSMRLPRASPSCITGVDALEVGSDAVPVDFVVLEAVAGRLSVV